MLCHLYFNSLTSIGSQFVCAAADGRLYFVSHCQDDTDSHREEHSDAQAPTEHCLHDGQHTRCACLTLHFDVVMLYMIDFLPSGTSWEIVIDALEVLHSILYSGSSIEDAGKSLTVLFLYPMVTAIPIQWRTS